MTGIYQNIVITTDGSEKNTSAVIEGLMIARLTGANVKVIFVIDMKPLYSGVAEESYGNIYESYEKDGKEALQSIKELAGDLKIKTFLLTGKPANEIIRFAKEHEADLLIVGTQGKSGLGKMILGSVAESVVRNAPCSVLVVRKS
jgi:nucleotide-binding universal stress UspA family protein